MYQAILFDLDDTLISLRGCEAQALERALDAAGLLPAMPSDYARAFAAISVGYWAARTPAGEARYTREAINELSWREFCRSSALNPGARETVQRLSERFRLGVISNGFIDSQRGRLAASALEPVFEVILISEEAGVAKPDPRIFRMALAQLRVEAKDVLYVGDSISHDLAGCLSAGIDFCHFTPQRGTDRESQAVKFRIRRLDQLMNLLAPQA